MADITMCDGKDCPLREKCYRFTVFANQWRQSYFMETPYNKEENKCDEYWKDKSINNKTKNQ